jgi:uncharacterized DUF497 family protein
MRWEWDEAKRTANLRKHGVDFADAVGVFYDDRAMTRPDPYSEGENRMVTLGMGLDLSVLYVVWVETYADTYRIISARKASPGETLQYMG